MAYSLKPAYYVQHELSRLIIKSGTNDYPDLKEAWAREVSGFKD